MSSDELQEKVIEKLATQRNVNAVATKRNLLIKVRSYFHWGANIPIISCCNLLQYGSVP